MAKLRELMQEFVDQAKGPDAPQIHVSGPKMYTLPGDRARPVATMGPVSEDFCCAVVVGTMKDLGVEVADLRARSGALNI